MLFDQTIDEALYEARVINALPLCWCVATTIVPATPVALGIDDQEAMAVCDRVEMGDTPHLVHAQVAAVQRNDEGPARGVIRREMTGVAAMASAPGCNRVSLPREPGALGLRG